ncbi:sphingosine kinase A, B [Novymonas esmeraldas]|uniref:Sphingosine kinase A, B n=1 Tax=Novymonas esmeraldas TaxID=1808958 RepID=A0AAW0F578_9TRYP
MSSLAASTTSNQATTPARHARRSSSHTSLPPVSPPPVSPPLPPPVLQTSSLHVKGDYSDVDGNAVSSAAFFTPKASTSSLPARTAAPLPVPACAGANESTTTPTRRKTADSGASAAAAAAAEQTPPPRGMPAAYPWNADVPPAVDDSVEAVVLNKGKSCTLAYSPSRGTVRVTRVTSGGKARTLLNIPLRMVINIESAAERDARQRARQANDDTIKLAFAEDGTGAGSLLCAFPTGSGEESDAIVFAHSRVNTTSSSPGLLCGLHHTQSPSQSGAHVAVSPVAGAAPSIRYYMHYVRHRHKEHPSIHTLEFNSSGSAEAVQAVVSMVVQRIYSRGPKHIIAFISAKSGRGKGERIFEKQVRPLLHFSRHTYQTYLTQRAHDCEDFVADLANPMDSNTVVAAVGGDGMIHETVNGVHRRKLALVRWLRSVTTDVETQDASVVSMNLSLQLHDDSSDLSVEARALATPSEETSTVAPHKDGSAAEAALNNETGVGSHPPFIRPRYEENKRNVAATSSEEAAAREARRIACVLVRDGWDALMPLVATVATGSACGLAKSLDVLSVADAALSLVHLSTVHMDLLLMHFTPNEDMVEYHRSRMSTRRLNAAKQKFAQFTKDNAAELRERTQLVEALHLPPQTLTAADSTTPFLKDGTSIFQDPVSCATRMPQLRSRVAFMSLSFGAANDIDHGSEPLRWMGNARFHVYGGYMMLLGLKRYNGVLRYLPWTSTTGKTMEKLHTGSKMPSAEDFPLCTMRDNCPHCRQYPFTHCGAPSLSSSVRGAEAPQSPPAHAIAGRSAAAALAPYTDHELLDEDVVNFDDEQQPWVTIRGEFCIALMCNVRDVAQDMLMAPLAHMSDGAIDVVYCRIDPTTGRGGRMEMLKFFMGLEAGTHVNLDFVNYVKARALEVKVDAGISMSDGELMPLSSVRMTKMRNSVQLVRSE